MVSCKIRRIFYSKNYTIPRNNRGRLFGMALSGILPDSTTPPARYLYNNKEFEKEGGVYFYGARLFVPMIGRFAGVDPIAEKFAAWSPYSYTFNNPIRFIDPTGAAPEDIIILGSKAYQQQVRAQLWDLANSSQKGFDLVQNALSSNSNLIIQAGSGGNEVYYGGRNENGGKNIYLDLNISTFESSNCSIGGDCTTGLGHEFQHFSDISAESYAGSNKIPYENYLGDDGDVITNTFLSSEISAVGAENEIRASLGYDLRQTYAGVQVFGMKLNTNSSSYFTQGGLTSTNKYWNLSPIKGFKFSPNLTRPSNSSLSGLWNSMNSFSVKTRNFSNSNTMSTFDNVSGTGLRLSTN